jgi:uncharacterized protein YbjT (DUF2867 family)
LSQHFSQSFFLDETLAGELALSVGDIQEPLIDAKDITDAAVAPLTDDKHRGRIDELTGPAC